MHLTVPLLLGTTTMMAPLASALSLRPISFNVRYAASPPSTGEEPWSVRAPHVISQLSAAASAAVSSGSVPVIGLQEVLHEQLLDIQEGLGSSAGGEGEWRYLGTGRDDGEEEGEYCPLFYRASTTTANTTTGGEGLTLLHSTQKWLSPTPDVPSFWPGAGSRRYVIVGVFEHASSGKRFIAANTHLDNASLEARVEGIKIALDVIRGVQAEFAPGGEQGQQEQLPVVLTGDFNSEPTATPGEDAYGTMLAEGYLSELYTLADGEVRHGPYATFSGFVEDEEEEVETRIDFVWIGPGNGTEVFGEGEGAVWDARGVERYEVVVNREDGIYVSDHKLVLGDVTIKG